MTAFAFGLVFIVALTAAGVLWPLWRDARVSFVAAALLLGALTVGGYLALGTPAALDPARLEVASTDLPDSPEEIDAAIERVAEEVRRRPDDVQGWLILGRARKAQQRFEEAREAFAQAYRLEPDQPDVMVDYAEAITLASESRTLQGQALDLILQALALQPGHQRGLLFLGVHYVQAGQPERAIQAWESLLPRVDDSTAAALRTQIEMARGLAAGEPGDGDDGAPVEGLRVRVELAPALQARVDADDALFVYARQSGGAPMPVAVQRRSARELPLELVLTDADSPMPTLQLSRLERVELVARISKSGDVAPAPGDLEAAPVAVEVDTDARTLLRIEHVRD